MSLPVLAYPVGMSVGWFIKEGPDRAGNRNSLVREVRRTGAPFTMFIDDDTVIPNFAIRWLHAEMMKDPKTMVVGGIYCTKTDPPEPLVFKELGGGPFYDWKVNDVFECAGLGTGCMLIRNEVFDHISEPWFFEPDEVYVDKPISGAKGTDDLYFCQKVKEAGFKIVAHGGVLPVHLDDKGNGYTLPMDAFPCQGANLKPWPAPETPKEIENALKITGWMDHDELVWLADQAKRRTNVVEVGSYLGRSTRALAENTPGTVVAVDTFEATFPNQPDTERELQQYPKEHFFEVFQKNMEGVNNVKPLKMLSLKAAKKLAKAGKKFDMVFIDAGHSYEDVAADIKAWKPLVKPGGLLCGHDFGHFEGVDEAVRKLIPNYRIAGSTSIWYTVIPKRPQKLRTQSPSK